MTVIHGNLVTEHLLLEDAELVVEDGRVTELNRHQTRPPTYKFPDAFIAPGLVDIHFHGALGHDAMDATPETLPALSAYQASQGVTAFLATTMTASEERLAAAVRNIGKQLAGPYGGAGARCLGVNLEGPYLSPKRAGAQNLHEIRLPSRAEVDTLWSLSRHHIRILTLAPEVLGAEELTHLLTARGVVVSAGHSDASWKDGRSGIDWGIRHATHLFNGMPPIHHRDPGLVSALLEDDRVSVELICDGVHLAAGTVKLVRKIAGDDRIVLVTDSVRATGLANGSYELGGQTIRVQDGVARTAAGGLAGSTLGLARAVSNYVRDGGAGIVEAIRAASTNPARVLGLSQEMGKLSVSRPADLTVIDAAGCVYLTMVSGAVTFMAV